MSVSCARFCGCCGDDVVGGIREKGWRNVELVAAYWWVSSSELVVIGEVNTLCLTDPEVKQLLLEERRCSLPDGAA